MVAQFLVRVNQELIGNIFFYGGIVVYWLFLFVAILTEVAGTTAMKLAKGFSNTIPSIMVFVLYGTSLILLTLALRRLHMSLAYAIWAGIGTALITFIGYLYFNEPMSTVKLISLGLIVFGVIGLSSGEA